MALTNDDLATIVLPWAKASLPEAYAKTLKVVGIPATYRTYLLRLVELRVEQDKEFLLQCPVSVLDETSVVRRMEHKPTGTVVEVKGAKAPGPHVWRWRELREDAPSFELLMAAKQKLDLELIPE